MLFRSAPEVHNDIKAMQREGMLNVVAGKIYYIGSDEDALTVAYRKRGSNRIDTIRAELVLNCSGPEYDIAASSHKLLRTMRDRELVTVGPLRIGIDVTRAGTAKGRAADVIFPLGTLLIGELLECTAVPELREQAASVAAGLCAHLDQSHSSDGKAKKLMGAWI